MSKFKSIAAVTLSLLGLTLGASSVSATPNYVSHVDAGLGSIGSYFGHINWSIDGAAEPDHVANQPQTIRFEKPEGATVRAAWLISGDGGNRNNSGHPPTDVKLNGVSVSYSDWSKITTNPGGDAWNNFNTYWGDVTDIVASTINTASAGIHTMSFDQGDGTDNDTVEGGSLVVIFDDPNAPMSSIYLNAGTADPAGSTFTFNFPALTQVNLDSDMLLSVGISNSYQANYWEQSSNIKANNQWLSSVAGGCDDSSTFATTGCNYGGYNTIGGIGDTPSVPGQIDTELVSYDRNLDRELYRLNSLMQLGDRQLTVNTTNPSNNDNIYFAGIYLKNILPTANYCDTHDCGNGTLASTGNGSSSQLWLSLGLILLGLGIKVARRI